MSDSHHVMRLGVIREFFQNSFQRLLGLGSLSAHDLPERILVHSFVLIQPWPILSPCVAERNEPKTYGEQNGGS